MSLATNTEEIVKQINTILISQPAPSDKQRAPYDELMKKYGLEKIDYRAFIHVEGVAAKEFRKARVRIDEYNAVIMTSKNSVDHFFRMCEEMRIKVSPDVKYFCLTEAIALYLQKYIVYRKRKVFFGTRTIEDLKVALNKHKSKEKFLLPCSNLGSKAVVAYLTKNGFDFSEAMMYRTVSSDLSDLTDVYYDLLVFFSPLGIQSLFENFPDFEQNDTRIAVFGKTTTKAVEDRGLIAEIKAPMLPEAPSMSKAIELYIKDLKEA